MKRRFKTMAPLGVCLVAALVLSGSFQDSVDSNDGADPPSAQEQVGEKAPVVLPAGSLCSDCHAEVAVEKHIHRPVRLGKCDLCHLQEVETLHTFNPPKEMGAVCNECHVLPPRNSFHAPARDGDCLACHTAHQSEDRYMLRVSNEKERCAQCHEAQVGINKKFLHGPAAAGACSLCHLSHSSHEPSLLRESGSGACLSCHVEMIEVMAPPNVVHTPVKEDCSGCHDPHASDHQYQLKSSAKTLCMDCHVPMKELIESANVVHAALRTEEGCVHCHEPHSSPFPNMLKQPIGKLCLSCHDAAIEREDGTSLPGMGEKIRNSTHLHGPLADGNCTACHDPHASPTFSLLRKPYPKAFYSPYSSENYLLCFGCHDSRAIEMKQTDTHTGFRDGNRNLHFIHVNDDKKGRTCRACHDHHASNLPKQMTASVPFGTWDLPIDFLRTATGGSCAPGCHAPKQYDRFEPKLTLTPPKKDAVIEGGTR